MPSTRSSLASSWTLGIARPASRSPTLEMISNASYQLYQGRTSCGFAFTAVASSFCVIDLPSAFFLSIRP